MGYSLLQISETLLKADRTMYKLGAIAYENMFSEDSEDVDFERDIIYVYKKAVEYADDLYIGTTKLDQVVERLANKLVIYDYGQLNPIYSDSTIVTQVVPLGAALNDLSDVTITNLQDQQTLKYNAALGQWVNVGTGNAVRNTQQFTATAGQTTFTTAYQFDGGLVDIFVNGVKLSTPSYTVFGNYTIILTDGCVSGDIVEIVAYENNIAFIDLSAYYVPVGRTITINGVTYDLSANRSWTTVSSVGISMPSAFTVSNSPVTTSGTLTVTGAGTTAQYIRGDGTLATFPTLTGYVPYTGATTNVNLGEFELKAGQLTLDTSPTGTAAVGTIRWNDTIGSSETTLKGGSVILKNGVDLVARVVNKVTPNATLTKASYRAVRISGAQGQRLAVAYAQANNDNNSADTLGLVIETIPTNQEGFIITVGQIEDINTTGSLQGETWVDGDVLYLSPTTPGAITNVKPVAPQHIVVIGYVEYAHAINGKIYVKVMNGWELGELHDVNTTGAVNGSVLKYNGTIWVPSSDIDTGITSLNGLTALSQTFATGTSGTDFNISSATSTHTFNLPTASAVNRGVLSSADWTSFDSKQPALSGTGIVKSTSGVISYITDNSANWNTSYDNMIVSAAVTGTTTKTLTLTQQDAGTITASWTDYAPVLSVFGRTGSVIAQSGDYNTTLVTEGTNLYFTDPRVMAAMLTGFTVGSNTAITFNDSVLTAFGKAQAQINNKQDVITLTTTGSSGAATFISNTLNVPTYTLSGLGGVPTTRTLTINGTAYDLSADRSYSVGTVTSITLATGTTGTDVNVTNGTITSSGTITLNIPDASATARGLVTTGTQTIAGAKTFTSAVTSTNFILSGGTGNTGLYYGHTNKVVLANYVVGGGIDFETNGGVINMVLDASANLSVVGSVTAASLIKSGGTSSQFLKADGSVDSSTYYLASNPSSYIALTALTASSPLLYNNTTGVFSIQLGTDSQNGYLSSSDRTTFNNKQDQFTVSSPLSFSGLNITISQASGSVNGFLSSTDWTTFNNKQNTITNPVTGTGTTNYLPKWTSGSAIGNSVIQESSNLIGVNVTPTRVLHLSSSGSNSAIRLDNTVSGRPFLLLYDDSQNLTFINSSDSGYTAFNSGTGASTTKMLLTNGGNLLVNSTTDNGNRLQITGNGYFSGSVGVGTTSPGYKIDVESGSGLIETIRIKNGYTSGSDGSQLLLGNSANFTNAFFRLNGGGNTSQAGAGSLNIGIVESSPIAFYTANTERMRLDSSGNLGLGVTPSNAFSGSTTLEIGANGVIWSENASSSFNSLILGLNFYYNSGGTPVYKNTGVASSRYFQYQGSHQWYTAPSGTAGNAITFTQAMTLTSGGNLLVGTTTDSGEKLQISGSVLATSFIKSGGTSSQYLMADGSVTTGGGLISTNRQTASYTLALTDADKLVEMNVATANNLTVPLNSSVAFAIGTKIDLAQYGAGQTTVVATGGVTVRSAGGALKLSLQYSGATLVKIATNEWYLFGDITV